MCTLYILIGTIASGKSTFCKNKASDGALIANDDDIVKMIHGHNYHLYDENLKPLYKSIENHVISMAALLGKDVVIDRALNMSHASRMRYLSIAHSYDMNVVAVEFDIEDPEVHAKRRFETDSRGHTYDYWLRVAQTHISMHQSVDPLEFDEVINGTEYLKKSSKL